MAEQSTRILGENGPIVRFDPAQWTHLGSRTVAALGSQEQAAVTVRVDVGSKDVGLLDGRISFASGGISLGATLPPRAPERDLFGEGSEVEPATGRFAAFDAKLDVEADGKASDLGPWSLSIAGSLDSKVAYRHLLAVPQEDTQARALLRVTGSARMPSAVDLATLSEDEYHSLAAMMTLGIEAGVEKGFSASIDERLIEVFDGLPLAIAAQVEGSIRATLGLALHGSMRVTVGRDGHRPRYVRIRIERSHQGTFTFGAMIAVQATYDLASSLESILDHALGLLPMPKIEQAVGEVENLLDGNGSWDNVRAKLSSAVAERISVLIGVPGWLDQVAEDGKVRELFEQVRGAVKAYRDLDAKVKSWWDHLLVSSGFDKAEKLRGLLGALRSMDPDTMTLTDLIDQQKQPELAALLELIELISGRSVEELVTGGGAGLHAALVRVKSFATQAMLVLDLPDAVLSRFHSFAKGTGIAGVVEWLEQNASDLETLKKKANGAVEELLARLVGKVVAEIEDADLRRIQTWVKKLRTVLDTKTTWEQGLKKKIALLKGQVGFNLAIELGRLATDSAILDVEVALDETSVVRGVQSALRRLSLDGILAALPSDPEGDVAVDDLPFILRECIFLSRRERWFKGALLLGKLLASEERRRITETSVSFSSAGGSLLRRVSASGRFVLTQGGNLANHFSASAELRVETTDDQPRRTAPCTGQLVKGLRLTAIRSDAKTTSGELDALVDLVSQLGLMPLGGSSLNVPDNAETAFALSIGLGEPSVGPLLDLAKDEARWNRAYLDACARWFGPGFSADDVAPKGDPLPSQLLPALLRAPYFQEHWTSGGGDDMYKWARNKPYEFKLGKKTYKATPYGVGPGSLAPRWQPPFFPVGWIVENRGIAFSSFKAARKADQKFNAPTPDDMTTVCSKFAGAVKSAAPRLWREPLFPIWYALSLVRTSAPDTLAEGRAIATLRWRHNANEEWQLATWHTGDGGLVLAEGLFPS